MTAPTITLLDASIGSTPVERNFRREFAAPIRLRTVSEGDLPPDPRSVEWTGGGVVISGSQVSVYDDHPWIDRTAEWVADAVAADVPVLGVCWGHQLIASAVGGVIGPQEDYELGYAKIERIDDSPLLSGVGDTFVAFESHSDGIKRLPADATLLAENDRTIQAFRVRNAFGVQFHPEYDRETARWVVEGKNDELPPERIDRILDSITPENHAETTAAKRVFENFEGFLHRRA